MPPLLTRSATLRRFAALFAAAHLTVAAAGPIVHAAFSNVGTGRATWSSEGPGAGRHLHDPNACVLCTLQAGGFAPASAQPLALATRDTGVEPPAVSQVPRALPPRWRILQRPPPSSLLA
jgi:hypothetical protein